ncbi:MAG: FtsX-like permease family protein, partial [Pseudomonadota bacterium]|nr:FtsX-like permease family protein [Pseudomonadota bacterium]
LYFNDDSYKESDVIEKINSIENIENISEEVEMHAMIASEFNSSGILVKGISKADLYERNSIEENIIEGNLNNFENKSIIIGSRLATFLRVKVNDQIELISSAKSTTPFGNLPSIVRLKVAGIFDVGMYNIDRNVIFMPKKLAIKLLNKDQKFLSHLEIFIRDISNIDQTIYEINKNIGDIHKIYTWESMHKQLFNALKVEKKVMFLILSLIVFVAAFNLISSIIMIVKDKERGIGILRSLGFTRNQVLRIFIFIGSIVGILGTIIGTILGLLITINIAKIQVFLENLFESQLFAPEVYFFSIIPSKVFISEIIIIVSIALALSLLSTLYPAWRASKIEPANILRYE